MRQHDASSFYTFGFLPDKDRTALIDRAVRRGFVRSVQAVLTTARDLHIAFQGDFDAWSRYVTTASRVPPWSWACYFDLVQAAFHEDRQAVSRLATELLEQHQASYPPDTVVTIAPGTLGLVHAERYARIIDSDPHRPLGVVPVGSDEVERVGGLVREGRALLADAESALLDEFDTLAHQIVLATGARQHFGGAATVFLWGAVVLNPERVPDRVTLVEALAHETAHALLFGLTLGANLTTNDQTERYTAPLRQDPRPMEGIVHATYVLARMNHALAALRRAPGLEADERVLIEDKVVRNRARYEAGLGTVRAHARFTPEGEAIFAACREAVDTAADWQGGGA